MSDVAPSHRMFDSWLKKDNSPIFSQGIIRYEQSSAQKLSGFMKYAQRTKMVEKPLVLARFRKPIAFPSALLLWYTTKNSEIAKVDLGICDVTTENYVKLADLNDVILQQLQIPKKWEVWPLKLNTKISQHKLKLLEQRRQDVIEALGFQFYSMGDILMVTMMVDTLSRAQSTAASLQTTLKTEREENNSSQLALQKHNEELQTSLEDEMKETKSSQNALQKQIDELKISLEEARQATEQGQEELQSLLSKSFQTSGTQTERDIPSPSSSVSSQETDQSQAESEELYYDALSAIDQSQPDSEEVFYDAMCTIDQSNGSLEIFYDALATFDTSIEEPEEIFYDALSTIDDSASSVAHDSVNQSPESTEEIFYDALRKPTPYPLYLGPTDSLNVVIVAANSILHDSLVEAKAKGYVKGQAAAGTIVKSMHDLIPFRKPKRCIRLGSGEAGIVYLHRHAKTNVPVALKVVGIPPKNGDGNRERRLVTMQLRNEMQLLRELGWMKWFPELYGCCKVGKDVIGIAMEFFGDVAKGQSYSILDCIDGKGPKLDKDSWMRVMVDVADGLRAMHKNGYLCNDLNGDNVLLVKCKGNWRAKIVDFGWSSQINKPSMMRFSASQKHAYKYRQRYNHLPPECVLKGQSFSISSDIYSLGRLAEFLAQEIPDLKELGDYGFSIYKSDPKQRPSLQKIIQDISSMRLHIARLRASSSQ